MNTEHSERETAILDDAAELVNLCEMVLQDEKERKAYGRKVDAWLEDLLESRKRWESEARKGEGI
jgi:hypothetical protein